jgi:putative zinc finger/helix-turn-helix YgiT family protein
MAECIECAQADLQPALVRLEGTVRGEPYTVTMQGLACPHCNYQTIDGAAMPEFGRLLADSYRANHGLLTSAEIKERRNRLGLTQQQFAQRLGVGVASIKRWEMGKIQERHSNDLIESGSRSHNFVAVFHAHTSAGNIAAFVLPPQATGNIYAGAIFATSTASGSAESGMPALFASPIVKAEEEILV